PQVGARADFRFAAAELRALLVPMKLLDKFINSWVYGGFLMSFVLLILLPVVSISYSTAFALVYLLLPLYQWHQLEEHADGKFQAFVNNRFGKGKDILNRHAIFVINVFGVWVLYALVILLAGTVNIGFGLIAVYITLINGVSHLIQAFRYKAYNPGLITSVLLFFPFGLVAWWSVSKTAGVGVGFHLLGLLAAIGLHAGIVVYIRGQMKALGV
ncbi:MAG: HXXEE domain-containing protein, partial [Verrucomicrobiota bacterium]